MIIFKGNKMAVRIGSTVNGKPLEVTSESAMTTILNNATLADNGKVYLYTGATGTYENGAYYILQYEE